MIRWKMTLSYLPVAARPAKFSQVWERVSLRTVLHHSIEAYLRSLVFEEGNGNVAERGVKNHPLGILWVGAARPGGSGGL